MYYIQPTIDRRKTPESELKKIVKAVSKGLDPIAISTPESIKLLREVKPALTNSMLGYIKSKGRKFTPSGKIDTMTEGLKTTLSNFSFNSKEMQQLLKADILQHQSLLYNLREARYYTWVATEQGGQDSFLNGNRVFYNLRRLGQFETMTHVLGCILYIDEYEGLILRYNKRFDEIANIVVDTYWGTADVILPDGSRERIFEKRRRLGEWVIGDKENTPKNKEAALLGGVNLYRKIEIKPTKKQLENNPNLKTFNMRSSNMIALSYFGFGLAKHCLGSASLLSVYCKDRNTLNLSSNNLAIICRVENTKSNRKNEWHYDWVDYERRLYEDRIREKDKLYYI